MIFCFFFFFNDTATTEIYTLSLHDALPIHLKNVFVRIGEGTLADYLNRLLDGFPLLLVGSYPELSNPEYQVKVTLESRDRGYLEQALADFLGRLPGDAVVKVT